MTELTREQRQEAIGSMQGYAEANLPEPMGDLAAGLLLDFFLKELGPLVYNRAIAEAQARMTARIAELDGELYREPFTYWTKQRRRGA